MALLCRVVAAPSSFCVEAARWFLAIKEPLNETETERELQTEQRREHNGLGCHNLVARIMGRDGIGREVVSVVYTCWIAG